MIPLLRFWLDLCLFRAVPQDGSASRLLLSIAVLCYFISSTVSLAGSYGLAAAWPIAFVELCLLMAFVAGLLYLLGLSARIPQTLSALTGAGAVLGLLSVPLVTLSGPVDTGSRPPEFLAITWLGFLAWNIAVTANILRHSMSRSFAVGVGASLLYIFINIQVILMLFPGMGESIAGG